MNCQDLRRRVATEGMAAPIAGREAEQHLAECASCQEVLARRQRVSDGFKALHSEHSPDAGFRARVVNRLETRTASPGDMEALGWAAWRLLPVASLVLVVLLGWGTVFGWEPSNPELLLLQVDADELALQLMLTSEEAP